MTAKDVGKSISFAVAVLGLLLVGSIIVQWGYRQISALLEREEQSGHWDLHLLAPAGEPITVEQYLFRDSCETRRTSEIKSAFQMHAPIPGLECVWRGAWWLRLLKEFGYFNTLNIRSRREAEDKLRKLLPSSTDKPMSEMSDEELMIAIDEAILLKALEREQ